jgi:uncharacterized protein YunC (DUF1805 family)
MPANLIHKEININGKTLTGMEVMLPHANLVLVTTEKGYVCCGYLDLATAEKFSDAAAIVKGVKTTEDLLQAKITSLTTSAEKRGIRVGMTGKEALEILI